MFDKPTWKMTDSKCSSIDFYRQFLYNIEDLYFYEFLYAFLGNADFNYNILMELECVG